MNIFDQAAKDLQIKKLGESIRIGNPPKTSDDLAGNDYNTNRDINQDKEEPIVNEHAEKGILDTTDEIIDLDIPLSDELGSGKQYNHISSKNEGSYYYCKYCEYKATQQVNLKKHQESIHEGVKYRCNQCNYQATQQSNLKRHQESIHEGVKYPCNQCDYQATQT